MCSNCNQTTNVVTAPNGSQMTFTTVEQAQLWVLFQKGHFEPKDAAFVSSIAQAKNPSQKQMYWVNEFVKRASTPTTQQVATAVVSDATLKVDLSRVLDMFKNARQHLKRPKITLRLIQAQRNIRFTFDMNRRRLYMNGEQFGSGYGWVTEAGEVQLRQNGPGYKAEILVLLEEFCAEPKAVAIAHGKLTGNCCFCSLPLSDPRSLNVGYGDTCAKHWDLPWGKAAAYTPVGDWVLNGPKAK